MKADSSSKGNVDICQVVTREISYFQGQKVTDFPIGQQNAKIQEPGQENCVEIKHSQHKENRY